MDCLRCLDCFSCQDCLGFYSQKSPNSLNSRLLRRSRSCRLSRLFEPFQSKSWSRNKLSQSKQSEQTPPEFPEHWSAYAQKPTGVQQFDIGKSVLPNCFGRRPRVRPGKFMGGLLLPLTTNTTSMFRGKREVYRAGTTFVMAGH